jgi:hypothetical protein
MLYDNRRMFSASNMLSRAKKYFKPIQTTRKKTRIFVGIKKRRFYLADRDYYWNHYLKSDHWKDLKTKKLEKNPICEGCKADKYLDVHHINYKNLYDVELDDLQTLLKRFQKPNIKNYAG